MFKYAYSHVCVLEYMRLRMRLCFECVGLRASLEQLKKYNVKTKIN